jgi:WD40 repeat protein
MNASKTCSQCGADLPGNTVRGLCPKCLALVAFTDESEETQFEPSSTAAERQLKAAAAPALEMTVRYFGDYELLSEIARGGMGVVFKARQVSLNRDVALKMILSGQFAGEGDVKRFHTEAEAAASLDHLNIVPIYEVGEHEGRHYFSMKLVEGGSLAARVSNSNSQISNRETAVLMAKVARAVHYAHQRGILHRDLKPANILLDKKGEPHVTDFGLAKLVNQDSGLTRSEAFMGTPNYMAPEQAAGNMKQLTTASDIFSLGAILYHLLAGQPPFKAETPLETMRLVVEAEPQRPRALNPNADRDLETICLKCLEKDPKRRYGSAEALAEDLERWLRHEPIAARPSTATERVMKWAQRKPALAAMTAAIALVAILGVTGIEWQRREAVTARALAEEKSIAEAKAKAEAENQTQRAEAASRDAIIAKEETQDTLAGSLYEQARAVRVLNEPGRRWKALELVKQAEMLRSRQRLAGLPTTNPLPARVLLRSEAVAALHLQDARAIREIAGAPLMMPALDRDGRWMASLSMDGGARLTDLTSGQQIGQWHSTNLFGLKIALSPDGKLLACASGRGGIAISELPAGKLARILDWPQDSSSLDASPEGRSYKLTRFHPEFLAFDPAGRSLFAVRRAPPKAGLNAQTQPVRPRSEKQIIRWDLTKDSGPEIIETPNMEGGTAFGWLAFSTDGKSAAFPSGRNRLAVRDLEANEVSGYVESEWMHAGPGVCSSKNVLAIPAFSGTNLVVALFDLTKKEEIGQIAVGAAIRLTGLLAFSPDGGLLAFGSMDGHISIHGVASGREVMRLAGAHKGGIGLLKWQSDGQHLVSAGQEGVVKVWELSGQRPSSTFATWKAQASIFAISPDQKWLAVRHSQFDGVRLVNLATGALERTLTDRGFNIQIIEFSPDSQRLLQADSREAAIVWEVATGKEVARFDSKSGFSGTFYSGAFTADGTPLVLGSSSNRLATVWNVPTGREVWQAQADAKSSFGTLSPDGRVLLQLSVGLAPEPASIWEISKNEQMGQLRPNDDVRGEIAAPLFSRDHRWLATFSVNPGAAEGFSRGNRMAGQNANAGITIWDVSSGKPRLVVRGSGQPQACAFSPDNALLAVGFNDGSIQLWKLESNELLFQFFPQTNGLSHLAFTSDGARLASSDGKSAGIQFLDLTALRRQLADAGLDW